MGTHNMFTWRNKKIVLWISPFIFSYVYRILVLLYIELLLVVLGVCHNYIVDMNYISQSYFSPLPGPSCSKLTTLLVNDSLKFTSSDTQIC